jgi:ankyrin repeat protein
VNTPPSPSSCTVANIINSISIRELTELTRESRAVLFTQEPNTLRHVSSRQSRSSTLGHRLGNGIAVHAQDRTTSGGESESDDDSIELHAFSHLRDSIRVAEKKVEEMRISRPPSIRSAKQRRGSVNRIDDHDAMGWTPLVSHINSREHAKVEWAMDNGANAEVKCHGKTPLFYAVLTGDPTMILILTDYQDTLDLESQDPDGKTALAVAAELGDTRMIDMLLGLGADIEASTLTLETPLMLAAHAGKLLAVECLIRNSANCNAIDEDGCSALHHAVYGPNQPDVQAIIQYLVIQGVDVNGCSRGDVAPLHNAVMDRKILAIKTLLQNEADWRLKDSGGRNCLCIAVEEEHTDIVDLLVDAGAVWEGRIPKNTYSKIKTILERSYGDILPPSRTYSTDSGISMGMSVKSGRLGSRFFSSRK